MESLIDLWPAFLAGALVSLIFSRIERTARLRTKEINLELFDHQGKLLKMSQILEERVALLEEQVIKIRAVRL